MNFWEAIGIRNITKMLDDKTDLQLTLPPKHPLYSSLNMLNKESGL